MKKILIKNIHLIIMLYPMLFYQIFFLCFIIFNLPYNLFNIVNIVTFISIILSFLILNTFIEFELSDEFEIVDIKFVTKMNKETLVKNVILLTTILITYNAFSLLGVFCYLCIQLLFMIINNNHDSLNDIIYNKLIILNKKTAFFIGNLK